MNEWEDIVNKSSNPMDRVLLSHSWAKYYKDFDDNTEKYEKVFKVIEDMICIKFNIFYQTYIQKVSYYSRTRFVFATDLIKESFTKANEREMFPPEINMLRFTLMYIACIREAYEQNEWAYYPIYVFEQIAEAIVDVWPNFFKELNVNIVENTW